MKQETPDAGWLESHDNPVTDVVRRVRDTIKDAIKGDLICFPKHSTYATIMRAKTSVYKTISPFYRGL